MFFGMALGAITECQIYDDLVWPSHGGSAELSPGEPDFVAQVGACGVTVTRRKSSLRP